jgi:hypothetical protein
VCGVLCEQLMVIEFIEEFSVLWKQNSFPLPQKPTLSWATYIRCISHYHKNPLCLEPLTFGVHPFTTKTHSILSHLLSVYIPLPQKPTLSWATYIRCTSLYHKNPLCPEALTFGVHPHAPSRILILTSMLTHKCTWQGGGIPIEGQLRYYAAAVRNSRHPHIFVRQLSNVSVFSAILRNRSAQ